MVIHHYQCIRSHINIFRRHLHLRSCIFKLIQVKPYFKLPRDICALMYVSKMQEFWRRATVMCIAFSSSSRQRLHLARLVIGSRSRLSLHLVRRCSSRTLKRIERMVQVWKSPVMCEVYSKSIPTLTNVTMKAHNKNGFRFILDGKLATMYSSGSPEGGSDSSENRGEFLEKLQRARYCTHWFL